jgi:hypothetical protein
MLALGTSLSPVQFYEMQSLAPFEHSHESADVMLGSLGVEEREAGCWGSLASGQPINDPTP